MRLNRDVGVGLDDRDVVREVLDPAVHDEEVAWMPPVLLASPLVLVEQLFRLGRLRRDCCTDR